jgi:hypothetical protein
MLRAANRRGERRPPLSVTKLVAIAPDSLPARRNGDVARPQRAGSVSSGRSRRRH